SVSSLLSVTRSRWTSTPICVRFATRESVPHRRSERRERGSSPDQRRPVFRRNNSARDSRLRAKNPAVRRGTLSPPNGPASRKAVRTAGAGGLGAPAVEALAARIFGGAVGFGRLARPPDEPERAEDRNLQHHEQKEDRPE